MSNPFSLAAILLLSYLIGSLPFAVLSSKLFGLQDPRHYGSGNPGATNVLRSGNKLAALLTLLGDCLKGVFAVWLAAHWLPPLGAALAGLAAFCGHLYPVFLRFKGGKGVATALGVLIGVQAQIAVFCAIIWLAVAFVMRYSSLAALCAALAAPLGGLLFIGPRPEVLVIALMSALLLWRHRANISRLRAGTEERIGSKDKR